MGIFCGIYSGIMFPSAAISFLSSAERQMHPTNPLWARHPARTSCGSAAVRHRMFILWFSLMFSFWRWLNPPKIWYKSWMFILPNMVFQLLKPSKNVNDCQWLSMVSKKKALPRHFASTIRPCCPSIDRDMCCPFIAAELMKAFASADLQSELNSQDKQKVYPPVLKHGWENVRKKWKIIYK